MINKIKQIPFFQGLSEEGVKTIARLAVRTSYEKGERLFMEDQPGKCFFVLLQGSVQLSKMSAAGQEIVIKTVKPPEVFAEVVLFEQEHYPVSAVALVASEALQLRKGDLLALLSEIKFRTDFVTMLMRKQRYLAERVRYLTSYDVEERFIRFIHEQYGELTKITVSLSKKDVAAAIGATPETLSRLLKRLGEQGVLRWEGNLISLRPGFWDTFAELADLRLLRNY